MISKDDLRNYLKTKYDSKQIKNLRLTNILAFNRIDREGYSYNSSEKRILIYASKINEKIYAQLPGKETAEKKPNKSDFRPKLCFPDGSIAQDTSMRDIWDVIDQIAKNHSADLPILASVIYRIQNMYGYTKVKKDYLTDSLDIINNKSTSIKKEHLEWNEIEMPEEIWEKLEELFNDSMNPLTIKGEHTSFEAFIKYLDILVQNEDCKYYEKNDGHITAVGRKNTCGTILSIIFYYEGHISLSELLGRFRQGVAVFKVNDYPLLTDNIITLN